MAKTELDVEPFSTSTAIARLVGAALILSVLVTLSVRATRDEWLTYVVVATGRIDHNVRLDATRLEYQLRWMKRASRPVERLEDAAGKFLTRSAAERCRLAVCTQLPLFATDLGDRPEVDGQPEIFKVSMGEPWRVGDVNVGDHVYAVPAAGSPPPRQQTDPATPKGDVVVPNENNSRERSSDAVNPGGGQRDTGPVIASEMLVVGIAPNAGNNATGTVFLTPVAAPLIDPARLLEFRARGIRITSVRFAGDRVTPIGQER